MNPDLEKLLQLPNVWRASKGRPSRPGIQTGYPALNDALHLGGWPAAATTELLLPYAGLLELRLVLPSLIQQQTQAPWLIMIDPPHIPFTPTLQHLGLDLNRLLIIYPRDTKELLWCAEQCLRSASCSSVLTWSLNARLQHQHLRRLQQAAATGQCWHILFRHQKEKCQPSPSSLRIELNNSESHQLQLQILKQRGGWSGQQLLLRPWSLADNTSHPPQATAPVSQWPTHQSALPAMVQTATIQRSRVSPMHERAIQP